MRGVGGSKMQLVLKCDGTESGLDERPHKPRHGFGGLGKHEWTGAFSGGGGRLLRVLMGLTAAQLP